MSAGRTYLAEHGLGNGPDLGRIVDKYGFGVVIEPLSGDERFRGWLSIPYLTPMGCKAIRFRNLTGDGGAKYGQAKGQPTRLYNPEACFADSEVIGIAEGELDAVAATEGLGLPTVGIPGASQWTARAGIWRPIFKNFQRVFVLRDGDQAGKDLAEAITDTLGLKARVIDMPEEEDVSSMLVQGRANEITKQFAEDEDDDEWQ